MSALTDAFTAAVRTFNTEAYDALHDLLHNDVVFNRVDDPGQGPIAGRDTVLTYLNNTQDKLRPQFSPRSVIESLSLNATHGQVSGIGMYQDNSKAYPDAFGVQHQPSIPFKVQYFFVFVRQNNHWLLTKASATPVN